MFKPCPRRVLQFFLYGTSVLFLAACQLPFLKPETPQISPAPPQQQNPCVVLALPGSGPYSSIAARIAHGAAAARQQLLAEGTQLRLETIDTEAPDWLGKLSALPEACAVVGGPLRSTGYTQARAMGLTDKRVFFTFLNNLDHGDEGVKAWRFFPSPQDQIDALVNFATGELNIHSYGTFYPTDSYGPRMVGLLEQTLAKRNMILQKGTYTPGNSTSWSDAAARLLNPVTNAGTTPVPQTTLEALFLPDSWKHMDMLTSSLMYNGEDRLVLLGTTLWEQGISGRQIANADKYALAVFPSAWAASRTPAALAGGNDFWKTLGHDFVRFAAGLALTSRPTGPEVIRRANAAASALRALAPISWDSSGIAHQKLFLFRVTSSGMVPVDVEAFKQIRANVLQKSSLRLQGLPPSGEGEAISEMPPALPRNTGQPATEAPHLSPMPQPSHKLRLPARPIQTN